MNSTKKYILLFIACFILFPVFALPGINEPLPTANGQYVYYRDYSFNYEAYIGFLQYSKNTYAIRYVAKNPTKGLPIIELVITLEPENEKLEFTGEKIVQTVTSDDTDVLNYMHDMFYEFAERRQKVDSSTFTNSLQKTEDFAQFGGIVSITYNSIVPLFNLESIVTLDNKFLVQAVKIGQITSQSEAGWSTFANIPKSVPSIQNATKDDSTQDSDNFDILDSQWQQSMDNFFLMGNNAIMFVTDVQTDERESLLRRFSFSSPQATIYYNKQTIETTENNTIVMSNIISQRGSDTYQIDIKILSPIKNSICTVTGITIYESFYTKHTAYFTQLINRYRD